MSDVFRTQVENNSDEDRKLNKFLIAMSWLAAAATVKKEGGLLCIIPWYRTFIIYLCVSSLHIELVLLVRNLLL